MRRPTLSVFLWAAVLTMPLAACANPGDLDPSFGTGGKVTTPSGSNGYINALVLQPDGKLVAAGYTQNNGSNSDFALVRYNADGSLDGSFGTDGIVTTLIQNGGFFEAVVLQPDGKLVAAGVGGGHFALVRYNADGSLDGTFGTGGKVITPIGSFADMAYALVLQPDGKLVAAGSTSNGSWAFALVRYNADGSLDGSFGTGGTVTTQIGSSNLAYALVLQP